MDSFRRANNRGKTSVARVRDADSVVHSSTTHYSPSPQERRELNTTVNDQHMRGWKRGRCGA